MEFDAHPVNLRCSALRGDRVLLCRRASDRVLPGGTSSEPHLTPAFVELGDLHQLDLRPPLAGHIRAYRSHKTHRTAPYLGNLWRPRRADAALADE